MNEEVGGAEGLGQKAAQRLWVFFPAMIDSVSSAPVSTGSDLFRGISLLAASLALLSLRWNVEVRVVRLEVNQRRAVAAKKPAAGRRK